jgi:hypothetical protein
MQHDAAAFDKAQHWTWRELQRVERVNTCMQA